MKDPELDSVLRALPRHRAPAGFAARVQRSLQRSAPAAARLRRLRLALAAGVLAIAMVGVGTGLRRDRRERAADLRREIAALQSELDAIESTLDRESPRRRELIYVGGDERADFFVEPSRLRAPQGRGAVVPVTYRGEEL